MKIMTKEEEDAHYRAVLVGGTKGCLAGLALGLAGSALAYKRYNLYRNLTLPFKSFLVSSSTTFCGIIAADRASRGFEATREGQRLYKDEAAQAAEQIEQSKDRMQRMWDLGKQYRYEIVTGSWVASLGAAWHMVSRIPGLTKAQKLVQARVYAQGLTLAVLIATAAFEVHDAHKGESRWQTVRVLDPNDPEHKRTIEKKVELEQYSGQNLWKGMSSMFLKDELPLNMQSAN